MAFNIFVNNQMELLAAKLAENLASSSDNSWFSPDIVVVQSAGMQHWLRLQIAKANGICANVHFKFLREISDNLMADAGVIEKKRAFNENSLIWMIMEIFQTENIMASPVFAYVREYFAGDQPELKKYQLAAQLASIFDQYIISRPDWLLAWEHHIMPAELETDLHAPWQSEIWRQLVELAGGAWHYAAFRDQYLARLQSGNGDFLPPRIAIFGITNMPVFFLDIFAEAANFGEVDLYYLNPCMEDWSYAYSRREIARLDNRNLPYNLQYLYSGNDLLASFGQAGRDYFRILLNTVNLGFEDWLENDGDFALCSENSQLTMLQQVQQDILLMQNYNGGAVRALPTHDRSIVINSCYSEQREVEVLLDQLLNLFKKDPVPPSEIVIMAPDITTYAPYIEAVFGETAIPYTIADRLISSNNRIFNSFMQILNLHKLRFTSLEIMDIFSTPAIYSQYGLVEEDLSVIRHYLSSANIRWSWDGPDKQQFGLPDTNENTWRFGFDRLLMGYAYGASEDLVDGIAPYADFEGEPTRLIGQLCCFVRELHDFVNAMRVPRPLPEWLEMCHAMISRFFCENDDYVLEIQQLRLQLDRLNLADSPYQSPLDITVFGDYLQDRLSPLTVPGRFCRGGVTFCSFAPMRSIPFEVIALLGMNNESFPRNPRRPNFDLREPHPRQGDISKRLEDRYIFLETILSARRSLLISYLGQDIKSNESLPPSVAVSELLDYLDQTFSSKISSHITVRHPLQAFSPRYWEKENDLTSYSLDAYRSATAMLHRQSEPLRDMIFSLATRQGVELINLKELASFLVNPARCFITRRLKSRLDVRLEDELREAESFKLDTLERYQLANAIIEILLTRREIPVNFQDDLYRKFHATGALPYGEAGKLEFDRLYRECMAIRELVLTAGNSENRLRPAQVVIESTDYVVEGVLNSLYPSVQLYYHFSSSWQKYLLQSWISHLALHASELPPRQTRLIYRGGQLAIKPMSPEKAAAELTGLVEFYRRGNNEPFCFFPATSMAYLRTLLKTGNQSAAAKEAANTWYSNSFARGDNLDTYVRTCFGIELPPVELLENNARVLLGSLLESLEEAT